MRASFERHMNIHKAGKLVKVCASFIVYIHIHMYAKGVCRTPNVCGEHIEYIRLHTQQDDMTKATDI